MHLCKLFSCLLFLRSVKKRTSNRNPVVINVCKKKTLAFDVKRRPKATDGQTTANECNIKQIIGSKDTDNLSLMVIINDNLDIVFSFN